MNARNAAALLLVLAAACGSKDPVTYSAPVGISLDARSGDVVGGTLEVDKNVTTESGNPYGAFTNDAVKALGGNPSRIAVTSATLTLEPSSTNVVALQQVFTGTVQLAFQANGSDNLYPAASVVQPAGAGPVSMQVSFDSAAMTPADFQDLVGANFRVVLTGPAAPGFEARGATADMAATLTFVAYP